VDMETAVPRMIAGIAKRILLVAAPTSVEDDDGWGDVVHIFDGFKTERVDGKTRIRKREKAVNHGLWKRWRLWMEDPARDLTLEILNYKTDGAGRSDFDLRARAKVRGRAEMIQYSNGIHLMRMSVEADAVAQLDLKCRMKIEQSGWGPFWTLAVSPTVTRSNLQLLDLSVRRVGRIEGPLVQELGDGFRELFEKKLKKKESDLTKRIQKTLAEQGENGTIKLSLSEMLFGDEEEEKPKKPASKKPAKKG
ncbi:MAG: hypothetical protein ACRC1K_22800, partial [Planctomycetia bacterium]